MPGPSGPKSAPLRPVRPGAKPSAGAVQRAGAAGASRRQVGSVMVQARERGAIEVTDLGVAEA
jgi:hypothetical protein